MVSRSQEGEAISDVTHVSTELYLVCFPSEFRRSEVKFPHAQVEGLYLLPQCGLCKSFLIASLSKRDYCFSHIVNFFLLICFGTILIHLGVILATIGQRMT